MAVNEAWSLATSIIRVLQQSERLVSGVPLPDITWSTEGHQLRLSLRETNFPCEAMASMPDLSTATDNVALARELTAAIKPAVRQLVATYVQQSRVLPQMLGELFPLLRWEMRTVNQGQWQDKPDFVGVVIRAYERLTGQDAFVDLALTGQMIEYILSNKQLEKVGGMIDKALTRFIVQSLPVQCETRRDDI